MRGGKRTLRFGLNRFSILFGRNTIEILTHYDDMKTDQTDPRLNRRVSVIGSRFQQGNIAGDTIWSGREFCLLIQIPINNRVQADLSKPICQTTVKFAFSVCCCSFCWSWICSTNKLPTNSLLFVIRGVNPQQVKQSYEQTENFTEFCKSELSFETVKMNIVEQVLNVIFLYNTEDLATLSKVRKTKFSFFHVFSQKKKSFNQGLSVRCTTKNELRNGSKGSAYRGESISVGLSHSTTAHHQIWFRARRRTSPKSRAAKRVKCLS